MGYTRDEFPRQTVLSWHRILIDAGFEVELDPMIIDPAELPPDVKPIDFRKGSVKRDNEEVTLIPSFTCHRGEEKNFYVFNLGYFLDSPCFPTRKRRARSIAQHALAEDIILTLRRVEAQEP